MTTPAPIVYQPETYYDLTAQCTNAECVVYDKVFTVTQAYSNSNAECIVICGKCGNQDTILTAAICDPQPIQE